jgi:hypothetical protein
LWKCPAHSTSESRAKTRAKSASTCSEPRVEIPLDDRQHPLAGHRALVPAAEGGLHRDLNLLPGADGTPGHGDDAPGRVLDAHPRVLHAVGLGGRDPHAEHLDATGEAALEPLLVEDESREGHRVRPGTGCGEVLEEAIGVGHLRDLLRVDEGAELDDVDPAGQKGLDPGDLLLGGDDLLLHLQSVPQPDLVEDEGAHGRAHERFATGIRAAMAFPMSRVLALPPMS